VKTPSTFRKKTSREIRKVQKKQAERLKISKKTSRANMGGALQKLSKQKLRVA